MPGGGLVTYDQIKVLALTVLQDAVMDITGYDPKFSAKVNEMRRKNALIFFFSTASEPDAKYWCHLADQPLERFRDKLKKYISGDEIF